MSGARGATRRCKPRRSERLVFISDLATLRPEVVSSFTCREGIDWRLALPGNPETCTYAQGVLVGASYESNGRQSISGAWAPHDCVQVQLCPERDAGTCVPRSNASRPCDEDVSHFPFCKATEAEQRTMLCTPDAGSYSRTASACDGGVQLTDVHTGIGPTDSCFYADGGLIGAATMDDTVRGPVHGVWFLEGCTPTQLCP